MLRTLSTILLAAVVLLLPARLLLAAPPGIDVADFRGSDTEILLSAPGYQISEADFFLFAVVTKLLDPEIVANWDDEELPEADRERIRSNLELHLQMLLAAEKSTPPSTPEELMLQTKWRRMNSHGAAQMIWADKVVRDSIVVFPEDILYYFASNPEEFSPRESVVIRRLRVPFSNTLSLEERDALQSRAEELRREAAIVGGLEPLLRQDASLLVDAPGRLLEVTRDDETIDPQIRVAAFRLGLLQISAPIRTPAGFVLIEVVERNEPEPQDLPAVLAEIEEELRRQFLPQQFDYLLTKAIVKSLAINRSSLYQFMPGDADLYRVRDFAVTLDEFNALYPEIVGNPRRPNRPAIGATVFELVIGEVVTQELERENLLFDPFYEDAQRLSDQVLASARYVRAKQTEIDPTEEEVVAYLEENREEIFPSKAKTVWEFSVAVRNPRQMTRGEMDTMAILMRGYMARLIETARRQFRERLAIADERVLAEPSNVMENLPEPRDSRVRTSFQRVGVYTSLNARDQLGVAFDDLVLGQFTEPIEMRDGRVVTYFVSAESEEPRIDEAQLLETARTRLLITRTLEAFRSQIDEWKESGALRFAAGLESNRPPADQ